MKTAQSIRNKILSSGTDSLWNFADFSEYSQQAVAKTLSRLNQEGLIQRVKKGLYYFPKKTALGLSQPSVSALLEKIFSNSNDVKMYSGGTASFQNLGITTQVPAQYTLLGDRASKKIRIGRITARILRRSRTYLASASQQDIWILDAIRNLTHVPDSTPIDAITKIMAHFTSSKSSIKKLLRFARGEPPRVRAVLGAIADQIKYQGPEKKLLKDSLNPLTKYHLGIASVLSTASHWQIV